MTVRDFMSYLIYVEHAAENLQFYLWFKDYEKRFNSNPTTDAKLAPEWTRAMQDEAIIKIRKEQADKMRKEPKAAAIFKGTDFEKNPTAQDRSMSATIDPFTTPPQSSGGDVASIFTATNTMPSLDATSYMSQASDAFQAAGTQQPCKSICFQHSVIPQTLIRNQSLSNHSEKRLTE
jgi:hypothetical protein